MPGWGPKAGGLADKEIHALVSWLRGSTASVSLPAAPPHGAPERGRALFLQNCAGCHGVEGKGGIAPALNNPVFQTAATDSFIAETIRAGREHTAMPSFGRAGFGQQEIGDLLAFVRNWAPRQTARTGD
jgi:mono/diheme cytochrome c family protein